MIDPLNEDLILPHEATGLFPRGPKGKSIHTSAIYRFMAHGVRGVKLESLRTPRKCTSRQAVARFLTLLSSPDQTQSRSTQALTSARKERAVESELDRLGF